MNTALAMYAAENGAPKDVIEAKKALDAHFVNVDGGLIGGAALKAEDFAGIIAAAN